MRRKNQTYLPLAQDSQVDYVASRQWRPVVSESTKIRVVSKIYWKETCQQQEENINPIKTVDQPADSIDQWNLKREWSRRNTYQPLTKDSQEDWAKKTEH